MDSTFVRRVIWNVVPAAFVVVAMWMALAGEAGLLERHKYKQRLHALDARQERLTEENTQLASCVQALRDSRQDVQRAAARELLRAPEGSTIYRFEGSQPSAPTDCGRFVTR